MAKNAIEQANDFDGQEIRKGDTVATLSDSVTARICDLCEEGGMDWVRLRPAHQPYGRGVWHAADRVVKLSGSKRKANGNGRATPPAVRS
jgi:hypothetical protein